MTELFRSLVIYMSLTPSSHDTPTFYGYIVKLKVYVHRSIIAQFKALRIYRQDFIGTHLIAQQQQKTKAALTNARHNIWKRNACSDEECFYYFSQGQTAQQHSPWVAFSATNEIILACILVPQTSPLQMLWRAGEGPCVLHSRMSRAHLTFPCNKPHDVIIMLTRCLFCTPYPVDKGKIKHAPQWKSCFFSPQPPAY